MSMAFQSEKTTSINVDIQNMDFRSEPLLESKVGISVITEPKGDKPGLAKICHENQVQQEIESGEIKPEHVFHDLKQSKSFVDAKQSEGVKDREFVQNLHKNHTSIVTEFQNYEFQISHPHLTGNNKVGKLASTDDVLAVFFELLLLDMKHGLRLKSNMSKVELDELFNPEMPLG